MEILSYIWIPTLELHIGFFVGEDGIGVTDKKTECWRNSRWRDMVWNH